jgi:hypothetical protein
MSRVVRLAIAVGLVALAQAAAAQNRVYRCGADGRSYSQQPCADGMTVEVADPRSTPQVTQGRQVAQLDARLGEMLARQRQLAESAAARQGPVLIGAFTRATHDATVCREGSACGRSERSKHGRRDRAERVTLYRAPAAAQ